MVRGHAKAVSQAKNAAKMADKAASAKRDGSEVRNAREQQKWPDLRFR